MELPFKRPPWLRWQTGRASSWLEVCLVVFATASVLVPILIERNRLSSDFRTAFLTRFDLLRTQGPTTYDYLVWGAILVFLGWFTYLSNSPRVREIDKFVVFVIFCSSAVCVVEEVLIHHFAR